MQDQDIKIVEKTYSFKFRVSGLLKKDDKFLIVEVNDAGFFCLPGGHVELGETSEHAIKREMEEETGYPIKIESYLGVVENYFYNKYKKNIHEICFYYLVSPEKNQIPKENYTLIENDHGYQIKQSFQWVTKEEINKYDIRPEFLKKLIETQNLKFHHKIVDDRHKKDCKNKKSGQN